MKASQTVSMMSLRHILVVSVLSIGSSTLALAGDSASGTVSFQAAKGVVKFGFLVCGPDQMDPSKTVLRLYLSSADIGAKVKAAKTFSDADNALTDGAMVDFGDARHLGYAIRLTGERVQYSGGTDAGAFTLTTNKPDHLAGKLQIDDTASGGAKVDATFALTS